MLLSRGRTPGRSWNQRSREILLRWRRGKTCRSVEWHFCFSVVRRRESLVLGTSRVQLLRRRWWARVSVCGAGDGNGTCYRCESHEGGSVLRKFCFNCRIHVKDNEEFVSDARGVAHTSSMFCLYILYVNFVHLGKC